MLRAVFHPARQPFQRFVDLSETAEFAGGQSDGGEFGGQTFQRGSDLKRLLDILKREAGNVRPAARVDLYKPFSGQTLDRPAHRSKADAQLLRQFVYVQPPA